MKARLSMAFADLRGKSGTVVISKGRNGLVLRPRQTPDNPRTAAQVVVRGNFAKAARSFKGLSASNFNQWKYYATTITRVDPVTGATYSPTPIDLFVGLGAKYLQANPNGSIPQTPPANPFSGDPVTLTVTSTVGGVTLTASGPNSANVKTEILIRVVGSGKIKPSADKLRSWAFVGFAAGSLTYTIGLVPGFFALGYRFVNIATGQETAVTLLPLCTVTVTAEQSTRKRAA